MFILDLRTEPSTEGQRFNQPFSPRDGIVASKFESFASQPTLFVVSFDARCAGLCHCVGAGDVTLVVKGEVKVVVSSIEKLVVTFETGELDQF